MIEFFAMLVLIIGACCGVMILPAWWLIRLGRHKAALLTSAGMTAVLVLDRTKNWDGVVYPVRLMGAPTYFFWFTLPAGLVAIALSTKCIYDDA